MDSATDRGKGPTFVRARSTASRKVDIARHASTEWVALLSVRALETAMKGTAETERPVDPASKAAAVSAIFRDRPAGLEVLFIRRAERHGDPWSGHMAFPGGRREP